MFLQKVVTLLGVSDGDVTECRCFTIENWVRPAGGTRPARVAKLPAVSGGTGRGGLQHQLIKLLYKNPLEIPKGIPS